MLSDEEAMAQAVALGERGRLTAAPNPWVGSVIVGSAGDAVGRGFHRRAGEPHAEAHALAEAGPRARGSTVYVTLEPCAHHGRTPPCAEALAAAGVRRVVVAVLDPDERVAGRGIALLRDAGISVRVGVCAGEAARSLAPYLHHRRTGRPLCLLKTATSLDGRTAAADGTSQWITGPEARADAHRLRAESGAVVVGAGTALTDEPSLTWRNLAFEEGHTPPQPLRVLLDASGRVPPTGPLFDLSLAPTLVITTAAADPAARKAWEESGAAVEAVQPALGEPLGTLGEPHGTPGGAQGSSVGAAGGAEPPQRRTTASPGGVDLAEALAVLGRRGILQAMFEGGATLHGALLATGLVDRLVVYTGGAILGADGHPLFGAPGPRTLSEASRWRLAGVRQVGGDARLDWEPIQPGNLGGSPASPYGS